MAGTRDLFGRAADLALGQHRAAGMLHRREQMHRAAVTVGWVGAAQRLAIDRHRPLQWPLPLAGASAVAAVMALPVGQPGADRDGQHLGVQTRQGAADGGLSRHHPVVGSGTAGAQRSPHRLRRIGGHSAIAATDRAPASTAAAAMARMATREWRRPRVARGSGTAAR
jgi:hypothetical protein